MFVCTLQVVFAPSMITTFLDTRQNRKREYLWLPRELTWSDQGGVSRQLPAETWGGTLGSPVNPSSAFVEKGTSVE